MAHIDRIYNDLCTEILTKGFLYKDKSRADISMVQIPSYTLDIDMRAGFPLLTTKKIYWKIVVHELLWMLSGTTNIDYLVDNGIKIWDKDAFNYSGGTHVGRIYGAQWRFWTSYNNGYVDQISNLIANLKNNLHSRRHIVTAWNPAELEDMALPPCHWSFEILPMGDDTFTLKWHQRSCDTFLGIPFDIASYALMGKIIERETGLIFRRLIGDLSNVHFYQPHIVLIRQQLDRDRAYLQPQLHLANYGNLKDLRADHFNIINYVHQPAIKAEMYAKVKQDENI